MLIAIREALDYRQMTQGRRHLWERPGVARTLLGIFLLPILLVIVLYPFYLLSPLLYGLVAIAVFIFCPVFFAYSFLYRPKFPLQVREELVARPEKRQPLWAQGRPQSLEDRKPYLSRIVPLKVDLLAYIHGKANRNVLITGASGQGKSKLSRYLLGIFDYQKIIFSFKAGDEYLKMGYETVDVSKMLPDPFADTEAFVNAFLVAFPVASVGIQASLVPTNLDRLAKASGSWEEFERNAKAGLGKAGDVNTRSAVAFIQANLGRLVYRTGEFKVGAGNVVFDFSALNDDAKNFYAELVLRQIYSEMEKRLRKDILICVDEAHRLTGSQYGKYHTILVEMSREIRDKGMLWAATQNYTDILDPIRNQFGTQFLFKTTSEGDQVALRAIDNFLAWTASSLPNHYFIDVQFPNLHTFIPLYYYNPKGEKNTTFVQKRIQNTAVTSAPLNQPTKLTTFKPPENRPTATIHAALLAVYNKPEAKMAELVKYLRENSLISSPTTLYGNKGRLGIFSSAMAQGYIKEKKGGFELTTKGKACINPNRLMEGAQNLGSDLHKQLMKKTIERLHKENMLVTVPKEGFDLIAYPVDKKKKYLWDDANRRAYEIQTTARPENVAENRERGMKYRIPITWVCYDKRLLDEIRKLTDDKDGYLLIGL